jgi:DNA-binding SARP family transcriptional activator
MNRGIRRKRRRTLVEFRILGPLEVRLADQGVDIGHARQRSVLAVLLLDLGQVVPMERLIDRVWARSRRPPSATFCTDT